MKRNWTSEELIEFEEKVANLFLKGTINCPIHLSGGNEDSLISIFGMIDDQDYVFSTHRNHYHYLLKGGSREALMAELLGLPTGICKGKGRSMHIYDTSINFYTSGIIGGTCAIAVGVGMAIKNKYRKSKKKVPMAWVFCGDGTEDSGHFTEAVRLGMARQLPVTFIIEDNDFAVDSTKVNRWHNYVPMGAKNILRYSYKRRYPHVGVGRHVSF